MRGEQEDQGLFENERQRNCPIRGGGGGERKFESREREKSFLLESPGERCFLTRASFCGTLEGAEGERRKEPASLCVQGRKETPQVPPPVLNGKGRGGQQQAAGPSGVNIGKATRGREELSPPSFLGRLSRKAKLLLKSP